MTGLMAFLAQGDQVFIFIVPGFPFHPGFAIGMVLAVVYLQVLPVATVTAFPVVPF